ncbi:MAG: hypothetical protein EHM18_15165 [Acidobacteria bacterium]|nr:MAG: hypothetical protein EHM18_15165 [Acidobacteriota bacterium]
MPAFFSPPATFLAADPNATFVILPSDHFVYPESVFAEEIGKIARTAKVFGNRLVLLGVKPDRPEQDYGWIQTGREQEERLWEVTGFREKPASNQARSFLRGGHLWNTMVMAATGQTLWRLGRSFFPRMMEKFTVLRGSLEAIYHGTPKADRRPIQDDGTDTHRGCYSHLFLVERVYADMTPADFSTEFLQRASQQMLAYEMDDRVLWSDWGRPERVCESLRLIGKTSRFCQALAICQPAASGGRG